MQLLLAASAAGMIGLQQPSKLIAAAAQQAPANVTVLSDGQAIGWSALPFVEKGTTYVPVREFVKAADAKLDWNARTNQITIKRGARTINLIPGSTEMIVNGQTVRIPNGSRLVHYTTYLPFRSVTEALGIPFELWNKARPIINLNVSTPAGHNGSKEMTAVDAYLKRQNFTGIALIAKNGTIMLEKGYGPADSSSMNDKDTLTRIASITKQFTAAAVLKLCEEGALQLDEPLSAIIPDFPRGDEITIHMLLAHTAGLPSDIPRTAEAKLEDTVAAIKRMKLVNEPGTTFRYSNPGYVLLASVIEQRSGMSYGEYLRRHFFEPAGMNQTGEASPDTPTNAGHLLEGSRLLERGYYISQSGTGSLYSTASDLLKWHDALFGGKVLSRESVERIFEEFPERGNSYYGWEIREMDGRTIYSTTGGGAGYTTLFSVEPAAGTVLILLSNQQRIDIQSYHTTIRSLLQNPA
ncbi:serine hydrolase [Paenibacillus tarimensis]|uniref:serine hydrolase n=2 Tax=Paenibacillus tarimensis TaxID=416012 RepID=UPI001F1AF245|nr:serine hydrolase [Paenibacillus tarimensis]MCF2944609.1 serine hydrolase [Paenibacillus tarimensis]